MHFPKRLLVAVDSLARRSRPQSLQRQRRRRTPRPPKPRRSTKSWSPRAARSETFKDVPMTVNVFTAETIKSAGIEKPGDFIARVPNMTLVETQNAGNAFVTVRGISQARNSEPSVAVLVDGVLETNPAEFNQELFDIEQIEVLKGPQGAVYGRNAIGGAIIIRTADPGDEFAGRVKVGYGNENSVRAQAGISGPIGDTFKYRASLSYYDTDGFLPSTYPRRQGRSGGGSLRPRAPELRAQRHILGRRAVVLRQSRHHRFLLRDPARRRGESVRQLHDAAECQRRDQPHPGQQPGRRQPRSVHRRAAPEFQRRRRHAELGQRLQHHRRDHHRRCVRLPAARQPRCSHSCRRQFPISTRASSWICRPGARKLRFTSTDEGRVRWIAGAYFVHTDRFISTGNMVDTGAGVFPVYREPRLTGNNRAAPSWPTRRTTMPGRCSAT